MVAEGMDAFEISTTSSHNQSGPEVDWDKHSIVGSHVILRHEINDSHIAVRSLNANGRLMLGTKKCEQ